MKTKRIIVLRFDRHPQVCRSRVALLRKLNRGVPICGIFGGEKGYKQAAHGPRALAPWHSGAALYRAVLRRAVLRRAVLRRAVLRRGIRLARVGGRANPNPHLVQGAYWEAFLASSPWGPYDTLSPRVSKLTEEQIAAKLKALRMYRTQYPALSGGDRDSLADPLVLGFEVFWSVPDTGGA